MTINEWDEDIASMSTGELEERLKALQTLGLWGALKKEFGWTGLWVLAGSLEHEIERRYQAELRDVRGLFHGGAV